MFLSNMTRFFNANANAKLSGAPLFCHLVTLLWKSQTWLSYTAASPSSSQNHRTINLVFFFFKCF